jgi:hypothetical protein
MLPVAMRPATANSAIAIIRFMTRLLFVKRLLSTAFIWLCGDQQETVPYKKSAPRHKLNPAYHKLAFSLNKR